jgi:hypothetical protein
MFITYIYSDYGKMELEHKNSIEWDDYDNLKNRDVKTEAVNAIIACANDQNNRYYEKDLNWEDFGDMYCLQLFNHIKYIVEDTLKNIEK